MKNSLFSMLTFLAIFTYHNVVTAQYCTPMYGFQIDTSANEVIPVTVDAENGPMNNINTLTSESVDGILSATFNINNKLMYYIASGNSQFYTVNSVSGDALIDGFFNVEGLKELEYNCENEVIYGFRENNTGIDLVSVDWEAKQIDNIFRFNATNTEITSSAINAKGDLIFVVTGGSELHTYNISTGTVNTENLNVTIIDIEYDVNDNIMYAYTESGAFGSIENGVFTQIGNEIPPEGEPISTAFDPFTNTFFIANNTTLFAIDTQTGDVNSEVTLSQPLYRLNAGIPCQIVADFNPDNTCIDLPVQFIDASIGASQWQWDFGDGIGTSTEQNPSYTYNTAGMYDVRLQVSGCELGIDDTTIVITITEQPIVDLGEDIMACGDSYRINPGTFDPSFDLSWTFGVTEPTFNVTRDGTYSLLVSNGGCFGTDEIEVTLLETPEVDLGEDQSFCDAVDVQLDADNSGLEVAWSTGETSQEITVNDTGIYWVDVSNAACTARDSISIELFDAFELNLGDDVTLCAESYQLDAGISGPGVSYQWSNGPSTQTITVTNSGTYSVEVSSGNCSTTDEIEVNFSNNIMVSLGEDIEACEGDTFELDAGENGDSYLWNDGSTNQTLAVSGSGEYSVEIVSGECRSLASIQVIFNEVPTVVLPADITACSDTTVVLSAPTNNNYTYEWSSGETSQTIIANTTGNYSLTVSNGGCEATDDIRVTINPVPEVNLGEDQAICLVENDVAVLSAGENFVQYTWSTGEESPAIQVITPGNYALTVVDDKGCTNSDDIVIIEQCAAQVYVPSAFSPNGDAQNDLFKPTVKFVESYAFKVFNRFGQTVFSTTDQNAAWDGVFQNMKQPIGVFSWIVEYTTEGGETQKKKGNVTLIR